MKFAFLLTIQGLAHNSVTTVLTVTVQSSIENVLKPIGTALYLRNAFEEDNAKPHLAHLNNRQELDFRTTQAPPSSAKLITRLATINKLLHL